MELKYLKVLVVLCVIYIIVISRYYPIVNDLYNNKTKYLRYIPSKRISPPSKRRLPHITLNLNLREQQTSPSPISLKDLTPRKDSLNPLFPNVLFKAPPLTLPRIIHQTWKTKELPKWAMITVNSWKTLNPSFTHILWDDDSMSDFIQYEFPFLWPIYNLHLSPVQKADVFRYAVIHKYGGVYADLDVLCVVPVNDWSLQIDYFNVDMIVGWEALPSKREVELKHFAVEHQLCQWTFAALPGNWLLTNVLNDIYDYYEEKKHLDDISIIKSTGPGMFSLSIKKSLQNRYNNVTFGDEWGLKKDIMKNTVTHIGSLYILPLNAFGSRGHDFTTSEKVRNRIENRRLVIHNFQGSWKKDHKRRKEIFKKKKRKEVKDKTKR